MKTFIAITLLLVCNLVSNVYSQNFDTIKVQEFFNCYFNTTPDKKCKIFIVDEYMTFMFTNRKIIYNELKDILKPSEIDSLEDICNEISKEYKLKFQPLSNMEFVNAIKADSIRKSFFNMITIEQPRKWFQLYKKYKVFEPDSNQVIFRFSPPLFIGEFYCLIRYSVSKMSDNLFLYKKDKFGCWKENRFVCGYLY